jgi:hypothetical protein
VGQSATVWVWWTPAKSVTTTPAPRRAKAATLAGSALVEEVDPSGVVVYVHGAKD